MPDFRVLAISGLTWWNKEKFSQKIKKRSYISCLKSSLSQFCNYSFNFKRRRERLVLLIM